MFSRSLHLRLCPTLCPSSSSFWWMFPSTSPSARRKHCSLILPTGLSLLCLKICKLYRRYQLSHVSHFKQRSSECICKQPLNKISYVQIISIQYFSRKYLESVILQMQQRLNFGLLLYQPQVTPKMSDTLAVKMSKINQSTIIDLVK